MPLAYRSREEEKPTTNTPPEEIPLGIQNLAVEVGVDAAREVSVHGAFVYCMEENAPAPPADITLSGYGGVPGIQQIRRVSWPDSRLSANSNFSSPRISMCSFPLSSWSRDSLTSSRGGRGCSGDDQPGCLRSDQTVAAAQSGFDGGVVALQDDGHKAPLQEAGGDRVGIGGLQVDLFEHTAVMMSAMPTPMALWWLSSVRSRQTIR